MKKYKYVYASEMDNFNNWEVVGIFPVTTEAISDM